MDFVISFFKGGAYFILAVVALVALYFGVIKTLIFFGKLFDIDGLYHKSVEIAEKSTVGIITTLKKMHMPLLIILLLFMFGFAYVDYKVVEIPIKFQREKEKRYAYIKARLIDIRTAENAYKDKYGKYADNFDDLINFVNNDSIPIVRNLGSYNEDTLTEQRAIELGIVLTKLPDTLTAERAVELGYAVRDTIKIPVRESIFPKGFVADSLRYVPFSGVEFHLGAGEIKTGSGVTVQVFEAYDPQPFDKWDTLKVGSLKEANNGAGNWGE